MPFENCSCYPTTKIIADTFLLRATGIADAESCCQENYKDRSVRIVAESLSLQIQTFLKFSNWLPLQMQNSGPGGLDSDATSELRRFGAQVHFLGTSKGRKAWFVSCFSASGCVFYLSLSLSLSISHLISPFCAFRVAILAMRFLEGQCSGVQIHPKLPNSLPHRWQNTDVPCTSLVDPIV